MPEQPLIHHLFPNTDFTLHLTVRPIFDLREAVPHCSLSAFHPTLPREAENFPKGIKYPRDVPLPTCLAYLQPVSSIILD